MEDFSYIVVQAGGKGTRLGYLTQNRPKCLVPINNLPMIFHLFRRFPKSKFIIIGDYLYDVLEKYLAAFADVDYTLVCATGKTGTCAGMYEAVGYIPEKTPFMVIWSDLIMPDDMEMPKETGYYIGLAKDFWCRWKYENGKFKEERSSEYGVAGLFIFEDSAVIRAVPEEGEFVRWLSTQPIRYRELPIYHMKEYGLLEEYQQLETSKCRPFNRTYIEDGYFVKQAIDKQGEQLAVREVNWYQRIRESSFDNIPKIVAYHPLKMELIDGKSVYEYTDLADEEKRMILRQIISTLKQVHEIGAVPADKDSYMEAYIGKTFQRLSKIYDMVPFAKEETIMINGKVCRNVFMHREELEQMVEAYLPEEFKLIHGDCTYSNTMLRNRDHSPVLIDPRGYFGFTELYGDTAYDWAKLYYSIVGNYDQFNRKRFRLKINADCVELSIESNGWEMLEKEFFEFLQDEVSPEQIRLIHALIWLSLTTYAWEDYDSICGAFYNGLWYLEDCFQ